MYKLENDVAWTEDLKNAFKHNMTRASILYDNNEINEDNNLVDLALTEERYISNYGFIGSAVARKLTLTLQNSNNPINIEDKDLTLKIGAVYNNSTYYINYGNFLVYEPPQTDETSGKVTAVAYDYMIKFDKPYVDEVNYPVTLGALLSNICQQAGVTLGTTDFPNKSFSVTDNQFEGNTLREVLMNIAKCAFSWARIGQDNKLYLDFENPLARLPGGYTELDYIQSSGTQYIDTGVALSDSIDLEAKYQTISSAAGTFFGAFDGDIYSSGSKGLRMSLEGYQSNNSTASLPMISTNTDLSFKKNTDSAIKLNTSNFTVNQFSISNNLYIFALNVGNTASNYAYNMKLYSFKIYDSTDTLVRDFVPCKKTDGTIGLYDLVTETFFGNSGTGKFTAGPETLPIETITIDEYKLDGFKKASEYYGPVNRVIYADSNIEGQEEKVDDTASIQQYGLKELVIYDNLFAYTPEKRQALIQAGTRLFGLKYMPVSQLDLVGFIYLEANDLIKVQTLDEQEYITRPFNHTINYNGAVNDTVSAEGTSDTQDTYKNTANDVMQNQRTRIIVDKAQKQIDLLSSEVDDQGERIADLTIDVDQIETQVENMYNPVRTVTGTKQITLEKCIKGYLIKLRIIGNNNVFRRLYPADDLYPSDTLYPMGDSRITMTDKNGVVTNYELGITDVLRANDEVYDEYILEDNYAKVIRRVNADGTTKAEEVVENIGIYTIYVNDDTNTIRIKNYTADMEVSFVEQNAYTNQFVTDIEMTSAITQTAEEINTEVRRKVGEDEIISKINQSAEQIQINADKISLDGKEIDLTAENITIVSNKLHIDEDGSILMLDPDVQDWGGTFQMYGIDPQSPGTDYFTYMDANSLTVSESNNNTLMQRSNITPAGILLEDSQDSYTSFLSQSLLHLQATNSYISALVDNNDANAPRITVYDSARDLMSLIKADAIYTPVLYQTSQASSKKNFEPMKDALGILKDIEIYKYNMKHEDDKDKKHIGFVIGDNFKHSKEITSKDDDNVDIYSFVSLCCKAIQEQQEQIEQMQKEIKELKGEK